ncbi:hypothetical protein [Propionivibrio sp.]|uniref:hypothetical protein n=1 Tax=Propionivibrio sp. TaxID=2212460 RepID=UPI0039E5E2A5
MNDIPLKYSWIAAGDHIPDRIVIVMHPLFGKVPAQQKTVDRLSRESEEGFIERVMYFAREMMRPHGMCHHAELYCKYGAEATAKADDQYANLEHLLRYSAINDESCHVRAKSLAILSELCSTTAS